MIKNFSLIMVIILYFIILQPEPVRAEEVSEIFVMQDLHIIFKYTLQKNFIEDTQNIFYTTLTLYNNGNLANNLNYNLMLQSASTFIKNSDYLIYNFLKSQNLVALYYSNNCDIYEIYKVLRVKFELYVEQYIITNTINISMEQQKEMQEKAFYVLKKYIEDSGTPFYKNHISYNFIINNINWNSYIYTYDCQSGNMNFIIDAYKQKRLYISCFDLSFLNLKNKIDYIDLGSFNAYLILYWVFLFRPQIDIITLAAAPEVIQQECYLFLLYFVITNYLNMKATLQNESTKEFSETFTMDNTLNTPFEFFDKSLFLFI